MENAPKGIKEKMIFGFMMAFLMVYGMESYNRLLLRGTFNFNSLIVPLKELIPLILIVMAIQEFFGGPIARKIAFKIVAPTKNNHKLVQFVITTMTVLVMCPTMSLVATLIFKQPAVSILLRVWGTTIAYNIVVAYAWQLLVAGPVTRKIFTFIRHSTN